MNGAGKTTQLQIISGALEPDAGTISREKPDMKVAYLTQEFDVTPTHTVRVPPTPPPDKTRDHICSGQPG